MNLVNGINAIKEKADITCILTAIGMAEIVAISGFSVKIDLRYGVIEVANQVDPYLWKYATHKPDITCTNTIKKTTMSILEVTIETRLLLRRLMSNITIPKSVANPNANAEISRINNLIGSPLNAITEDGNKNAIR